MHTIVHRAALAALLIGLLALAACGSGEAASPEPAPADDAAEDTEPADAGGGQSFTVVAKEFLFEPASLTVSAGAASLTVDNQGVIEHDITIDDIGVHIYAAAGETASGEVTLPAGTYTFYCDIPGHRDSGMEGTVTAE